MTRDVRALAAQSLSAIALQGTSLRDIIQRRLPPIEDARDRALLMALLSQATRWWLRFDTALDHLLDKPLRHKEPWIHALLVIGLVQLEVLKLPAYAAVASTVAAARALHRPRYAGLVNAVLRRWQRERANLSSLLDAVPLSRYAHPPWLIEAITGDWPAHAEAILNANNHEPPFMLRVNRRRGAREALAARLHQAGYTVHAHDWLADALVLPHSTDITRLPGFAEGQLAAQDGAAQVAADLLQARDGLRVLDACAAPGGKACHLLERAEITLTALECDAARAQRIRQNFDRLGLTANVIVGDAVTPETWWDGRPYQRILIDAPCSASGVIRRRPDVRLHRRPSDIPTLAAQQQRILTALWPLLAPGGRLLYVTCSLLRAENEAVIAAWLTTTPDAVMIPFTLPAGQAAAVGWQILPGDGDLDGMYYAVVEKCSTS